MHSRKKDQGDSFAGTGYNPSTLVDLLRFRAQTQPERMAYTFLVDGENEEVSLTYAELDRQARAIASLLQSYDKGEAHALLLYPPGLSFTISLFGCFYAGAVAIPAYPPDQSRLSRSLPRLQSISMDARIEVVLTTRRLLSLMEPILAQAPGLANLLWLATDDIADGFENGWRESAVKANRLAILQYTSGSTGLPKGVMLSHSNLMHNALTVYNALEHTASDRYVSWLPTFHDMGFMSGVLQPLYAGVPVYLMSPLSFLQSPFRWLKAIARYCATISGGPNFAYDLCVRRISPDQLNALDLSTWAVAFNGAEPVRQETIRRFANKFSMCGFREAAFYPCYGLAEATLIVTGGQRTAQPFMRRFHSKELGTGRAVEQGDEVEGARPFVGCGRALMNQTVLIVHPELLDKCAAAEVGELWVSSPSVAQGYWNRPEESREVFRAFTSDGDGPFLRTGDLGFVKDGELFVAGRLKDLIIIRGRNHYPQDIERTVEECSRTLRAGCCAAFSIDTASEERLVVVAEVELERSVDLNSVVDSIRRAVAEEHELQVSAVALIKPGTIVKTSSGKIQRFLCREKFLSNRLETVTVDLLDDANLEAGRDDLNSAMLLSLGPEERLPVLQSYLLKQVSRVLKVAPHQIDLHQPLSTLGLDSLMAIELKNCIDEGFKTAIPLSRIVEGSSLMQLVAEVLSQMQPLSPASTGILASLPESVIEGPVSAGQKALWFLQQVNPDSSAYNLMISLRIRGDLDIPAFQRSFQALVNRHHSLRTTFCMRDEELFQRIQENQEVCFKVVDASDWTDEILNESVTDEAHVPFDLELGPLLRINLFRKSSKESVLLLTAQHIIADLWSLVVMMDELSQIYKAEKTAGELALPPLVAQYIDYAGWQTRMLNGEEGARLLRYWQEQLKGELPILNLPAYGPRPLTQAHKGASISFKVSEKLANKIKALARVERVTYYTMLLSAFQVLLFRYTGQEDLMVGSPAAMRNRKEFEGVVGYFVNPLVIRGDLSGDLTFKRLLQRTRRTVLAAIEHQEYPFITLVNKLRHKRDLSRSPIFQAMFALEKPHRLMEVGIAPFVLGEVGAHMNLGELDLESFPIDQRVSQFDITLMMVEALGSFVGSLQYDTNIFDRETMRQMTANFEVLLESIVANPEQNINDLALLTAGERQQILITWNQTARAFARQACIHELFEAQVEISAEAIAVQSGEQALSYRQLNERANQLGHYLRSRGVGAEVRVGICLSRRIEMVVAVLGVLKAGGAYVPLDPEYPAERLAFMVEDSGAWLVISQRQGSARVREWCPQVVEIEEQEEEIGRQSRSKPETGLSSGNLAYVIYTSGSTGRPKGVAIEHRNTVALLAWAKANYGPEELRSVVAATSICFDLSVYEMLVPLVVGGKVEVVSSLLEVGEGERGWQGSLLNTVPSGMEEMVRRRRVPGSVETVNLAGEALEERLVKAVYEEPGVKRVVNLYGPTECTTYSTYEEEEEGEKVSIGRPIWNTRVYVRDRRQGVVAVGVEGELYIGGEGVARGYLGRAEQTAERFMPEESGGGEGGGRMYRTGDRGRYRRDGKIEYRGRGDEQVKVRGYRIELGEVEGVMKEQEEVRDAVVVVKEDEARGKQLVGYVVWKEGRQGRVEELKREMKEKLPEYMVPGIIEELEEMPMTPNGKVDRRGLRAREMRRREVAEEREKTEIEEVVAGIWGEILGVEEVGVEDNFFDLGGHSLLATRVISEINDSLQLDLPLGSIFEAPTVAGFAEWLGREGGQAAEIEKKVEILLSLRSLSDEEVEAMINQRNA